MTETITVAVVAAIGAYIGSAYAFSRIHPRASDATAQAYRDMIGALGDYRSACLNVHTATDFGNAPTDEERAALRHGANSVSRLLHSAAFLLTDSDVDLIDLTIQGGSRPNYGELLADIDKALEGVKKSARQLFRKT
jgi:hypothetical protein